MKEKINYVRMQLLTAEEKRKVYSKMKKADIIEMLIENNRIIESLTQADEPTTNTRELDAKKYFEANEPRDDNTIIAGQRVSKKRCIELMEQYAQHCNNK